MSNKEEINIENKFDDKDTNLAAKTLSHEDIKNFESIKTNPNLVSDNIIEPTEICASDSIEPQTNKNILADSEDNQLPINECGDVDKDAHPDDSLDNTIKKYDTHLESIKQTSESYSEDSNTVKILEMGDKTINSDTGMIDDNVVHNFEKTDVEKTVSEDILVKESNTEKVNIENPVDNNIQIDGTEMLASNNAIAKMVEGKGISTDSTDVTDKIDDTVIEGASKLWSQKSDSVEDMLLRWDEDDDEEWINSTTDKDVEESNLIDTIDKHVKSPTHEQLSEQKPANEILAKCLKETEISSTIDISDVEKTTNKEISEDEEKELLKEDENLSNDATDKTIEDFIMGQNDINTVNLEPMSNQTDDASAMEVDTIISEANNDDSDLNKEIQDISPILSSTLTTSENTETEMDVDLSINKDESQTTKAADKVNENPQIPTEIQLQKNPVEAKVDVHNPDTSVKEYSVDLSIVTGEVNGPERNADCHDLLQIKEQSQDSLKDDSIVAVKTDHGLNKPDMMLEIPTQELIDFDDDDDDDEIPTLDETVDGNDNEIAQQVTSKETLDEKEKTIEEIQEIADAVDPKEIANQTKKKVQDKNDEIDSQTIEQVEQDKINENDNQNMIQAVNVIQTSEVGIKDKPVVTEKVSTKTEVVIKLEEVEESIESIAKEIENQQKVIDAQPSTSTEMTPDTADEVPDVSDSLGLLAESSRVVGDDDDDDGFDDEDFYQDDESSNQMTAEHSEDSNPPPSESEATDVQKGQDDKEIETPPVKKDGDFDFQLSTGASKTEAADKDGFVECKEKIGPVVPTVEENPPTDDVIKPSEVTKVGEKTINQPVDIETVKLSDTSDSEVDADKKIKRSKKSVLRQLLLKSKDKSEECSKQSPSKTKKLEIAEQKNFVNIVDLEESSSEEDTNQKEEQETAAPQTTVDEDSVTSVNIPLGVEVMCTLSGAGGNMSELRHKGDEMIISGVPKPPPHKLARLNTSEVTIKTASTASTLVIPEKKIPKIGLEIFNIDSDEDSCSTVKDVSTALAKSDSSEEIKEAPKDKCINLACKSNGSVPFVTANASTIAFYNFKKKRRPIVCQNCADMTDKRAQELVEGIREFTPILELGIGKEPQELVEISDSESEDEGEVVEEVKVRIGQKGAKFLEENLADVLNETWKKFKMDERLQETQDLLGLELQELEKQSKEINDIFNECQVATDKLRNEFYEMFEGEKQEIPALIIFDTPYSEFVLPEEQVTKFNSIETRNNKKRRLLSASEAAAPAKRAAIPLGYASLDTDASTQLNLLDKTSVSVENSVKIDDDRDISVVQLSAEAAPADLPPPGEVARAPVKSGMSVYAMRNAFGSWLKGKVLECQPKGTTNNQQFSMCRVKFEHKVKNPCKVLSARCLAYSEPADVRMTIGTRVIALCRDSTNTGKKDSFYAGVVAEIPNPVNNYRYLVFFDDGYAQYVVHSDTRLVCECSNLVWEEVHPFSREFVRDYLLAYPERPMVRLHAGQSLKTEWNGKWWVSRVVVVDASLVQVQFDEDNRVEWIYRGSTRLAPLYLELQAAERTRARPLPRSKTQTRCNMPYVEYTRTDELGNKTDEMQAQEQQQNEEMRRQRAVAKKSTATPSVATPPNIASNLDTVTSRVVYYTPKNAVKPLKMVNHTCSPKCKRTDVLALKDLRTYNPLAKPLLSGWERQIVRFKGQKEVMYRAPCGRRVRSLVELHRYLRATRSDMPVDLFDFYHATHCLAEFVLNKCNVGKKDLSHGKENVPVPCVNYYDDSLPEFCSYNTERTPTAGVPLNLDPDFLCGCDCTDDCADKTKCGCWKLTLEGARTIGLEGPNVGYSYKRLPEPLPSGIYECNSRCKCKHTCLNRVAQHPLQLKLQVFKTLNRGWGIRALNDVPKGSFLCVYAGNLLTDATANLDGLNEGDEYLAELDYIEVVEQMKEGFEEDIPDADKKLDKKESKTDDKTSSTEETSSDDDEEKPDKNDVMDDDFSPGHIGLGLTEFSKRLRRRGKGKRGEKDEIEDNKEKQVQKEGDDDEECITISDDEEVRQPSRFTAQAGMGANEFVPKYKSVRAHFGKDEACYIMDAKVQGNIGRYLNHSCSPNVFVQNVFVDTHDPRFPWVAFFALSHIRAGTELTWNYNYDIGSVPEKVLYCFCGAPNCRRRLL